MNSKLVTLLLLTISMSAIAQQKELSLIDSLSDKQEYSQIVEISDSLLSNWNNKDSIFAELTLKRAYANQIQNKFEKAIPDWIQLIELRPDTVKYYNSLAYAYWSINNINEALQIVENAYSIDKKDILTINNLAFFKAETKQYKDCIKYASIGLKNKNLNDQQKGLLYSNRSNGNIGLKKYGKAEKDATESLKYFPNNSFAYYYRAIARFALEKHDEACKDLQISKQLGAINMTADLLNKKCK